MRPIAKVIKAVVTMIPDDFEKRADLLYELEEITASSLYAAPELNHMLWDRLVEALEDAVGKADVKWKKDVQDLMATRIDYRTVLGE